MCAPDFWWVDRELKFLDADQPSYDTNVRPLDLHAWWYEKELFTAFKSDDENFYYKENCVRRQHVIFKIPTPYVV